MENSKMKENKQPLLKFAVYTFLLTWLSWGVIVLANRFWAVAPNTPLMMVLFVIGGISPAIAAIFLLLKSRNITGRALAKRIFYFKESPVLYVVVIAVAVLTCAVPLLLGQTVQTAPFYMVIVNIPVMVIGGGLEEIGWRFIFQPGLEKKMPFAGATVVTGVVWATWHLPLFFMEGKLQYNWSLQYSWSFLSYAVLVLGLSFFLAAIYRVSKSVLLCILFHATVNAMSESVALNLKIGTTTIMAAMLIAASFLLMKCFPAKAQQGSGHAQTHQA